MMHHVNLMQQLYDSLNVSFSSFSYHIYHKLLDHLLNSYFVLRLMLPVVRPFPVAVSLSDDGVQLLCMST